MAVNWHAGHTGRVWHAGLPGLRACCETACLKAQTAVRRVVRVMLEVMS